MDLADNLIKGEFRPWQPEAVFRAKNMKRFSIFDDVGIGKSIEVLGAFSLISKSQTLKALIITESGIVNQFYEEVKKFTDLRALKILQQVPPKKRKKVYDSFKFSSESSVLVINYGKLVYDFDILSDLNFNAICYDEAAILGNLNKTRDYARWLSRKADYVFPMTATPFSSSILQFYNIFDTIQVIPLQFNEFVSNFSVVEEKTIRARGGRLIKVTEHVGVKNLSLLKEIYSPYYIRRRKKDIKKEGGLITNVYFRTFPLSREQKIMYSQLKQDTFTFFRNNQLEIREMNPLTVYTTAQQILSAPYVVDTRKEQKSPKLDGLLETLKEIPSHEKVVIYAQFISFSEMIYNALPAGSAVELNGTLPDVFINENIHKFNNDKKCRFCVVTNYAEKGLNLQVANNFIFCNLPYTPDSVFQLKGRIDREGQESPYINVWFLMMEDTIETNRFESLKYRQSIIDEVFEEDEGDLFITHNLDKLVKDL